MTGKELTVFITKAVNYAGLDALSGMPDHEIAAKIVNAPIFDGITPWSILERFEAETPEQTAARAAESFSAPVFVMLTINGVADVVAARTAWAELLPQISNELRNAMHRR